MGRQKGTTNKIQHFREAVLRAYDAIGGHEAFAAWARENQSEFYTKIAARLIPTETHQVITTMEPLRVELTDAPAPDAKHSVSE